jgi:hypothetical protein
MCFQSVPELNKMPQIRCLGTIKPKKAATSQVRCTDNAQVGELACNGHGHKHAVDTYLPPPENWRRYLTGPQALRRLLDAALRIVDITSMRNEAPLMQAVQKLTTELGDIILRMENNSVTPPVDPSDGANPDVFSPAAKLLVQQVISEMDKIFRAEEWGLYRSTRFLIEPSARQRARNPPVRIQRKTLFVSLYLVLCACVFVVVYLYL